MELALYSRPFNVLVTSYFTSVFSLSFTVPLSLLWSLLGRFGVRKPWRTWEFAGGAAVLVMRRRTKKRRRWEMTMSICRSDGEEDGIHFPESPSYIDGLQVSLFFAFHSQAHLSLYSGCRIAFATQHPIVASLSQFSTHVASHVASLSSNLPFLVRRV